MQKMQPIFRSKCSAGKIPDQSFVFLFFADHCYHCILSLTQKNTGFNLFRNGLTALLNSQPVPVRGHDLQILILGTKNTVFK